MADPLFEYGDDLGRIRFVYVTKNYHDKDQIGHLTHPVADVMDVQTKEEFKLIPLIRLTPISASKSFG